MRKVASKVYLITTLILFFFCLTQEAGAIPSFARKYRTSCTTCHIGFSKLNAFGESYRLNGYQIPQSDEMVYVKEEPVSLGAPAWKKVWPQSVWPGQIASNVPLSMMATQQAVWNQSTSKQSKPQVDLRFPDTWKLFAAGDLGSMFSYWAEFNLLQDGAVGGTEKLFFRFNDLLAGPYGILPENALNVKVGSFGIAAQPFYEPTKRTLTNYLPAHYTVGNATFMLDNPQSGIETDGIIMHRLHYATGVVNGKNTATGGSVLTHKDLYWQTSYKFGGMALDGSSENSEGGLKQANNWVDNSVTLDAYGYYGRERLAAGGTFSDDDNFNRLGFDSRLQWKNLELLAATVFGEDKNADGTGLRVKSNSWFGQAEYVFYPWLIGAMRYEQLSYDDSTTSSRRLIPSLSIYARANVRFILEGIIYQNGNGGSDSAYADLAFLF